MATRDLTGRRRYSMQQHGQADDNRKSGDYTIKRSAGVEFVRLSWEQPTTIRIYPALDPENPSQFDPYRFSNAEQAFGDWIRSYPAARAVGVAERITFLLYDPADPESAAQVNPYWELYRMVTGAKKSNTHQDFWKLLEGGQNQGAALPKPQPVYFVQGAVMESKGEVYADADAGRPPRGGAPEHSPVVVQLPKSAGQALIRELNIRNEDYHGDPEDWENYYVNGDPVSLRYGRFVTFFQLGKDPRAGIRYAGNSGAKPSAFGASGYRAAGGGRYGERDVKGYDCFLAKEWNGMPATLDQPEHEALVRDKWRDWDSVLHFPSPEEQAALLARVFPPEVILFGFRDHPEWISDSVKATVTGRITMPVTGMPAAAPNGADVAPQQAQAGLWGRRPSPPASEATMRQEAPGQFFGSMMDQQNQPEDVPFDAESDETQPAYGQAQPAGRASGTISAKEAADYESRKAQARQAINEARNRAAARPHPSN